MNHLTLEQLTAEHRKLMAHHAELYGRVVLENEQYREHRAVLNKLMAMHQETQRQIGEAQASMVELQNAIQAKVADLKADDTDDADWWKHQ